MCGIAGILNRREQPYNQLVRHLDVMGNLIRHRGPDGSGLWTHPHSHVGFAHRRLSIIDVESGAQPMTDGSGNWIVFNGEIYNYIELRNELGPEGFRTSSDTEVILHAYKKWGAECLSKFRGMFAFAIWDESRKELFCARDRFGIKPLYYTIVDENLYFASEVKALLPFVRKIETDPDGFKDYLAFQLCLNGKTLFKDVMEVQSSHFLRIKNGNIESKRYWEVYYNLDWDHTQKFFEGKIQDLIDDSVRIHLRSDVPIGGYLSGGLDSSIIAATASRKCSGEFIGFNGKFSIGPEYDESKFARAVANENSFDVHEVDIDVNDFINHIKSVIYHLDYPVAGPGAFPQYMVSRFASKMRKVVLGGQGGDEIFGGYTRYLIAYFEQCIKAAIDGTASKGSFVVTYESIIPNLTALRNYKPMLQEFWREGIFEDMDRRYFRLINRTSTLKDEVRGDFLSEYSPFESFQKIFNGNNVHKESYFDKMTHFDFKTLLPALLQVEDRVSMAHGLESRVPFLDHPLVELTATIPANVKFRDGTLKQVLLNTMRSRLPEVVANRTDKMGFPTPLMDWVKGPANSFVRDTFSTGQALSRELIDNKKVLNGLAGEPKFGRKIWGLLCLELWQQSFHDKEQEFKKLVH